MIERHYDDEALMAFLEPNVRADVHLPRCPECSEKLDTLRLVTESLRDAATWNPNPCRDDVVPATILNLRAFADRMASEDSQAEIYLRDLLAGPREAWADKLRQHPEYRTAGVVRKLIAACDRAIDTMPPDAVEISALATDIAEHLDAAAHPSDTVAKLRGAAWRERAYALFYTGQFAEAERAVVAAETHFGGCVVGEYDVARVGIVRALVERGMESFAAAAETARATGERMRSFADAGRVRSADSIAASVLFSQQRFAEALEIWSRLLDAADERDVRSYAGHLSNVASCQRELGDYTSALANYSMAAALLVDNGNPAEAVRIRYMVAGTLAAAGRTDEALSRLRVARQDFEDLGMHSEAALAALDIADLLLSRQEHAEVVELCASAMSQFERSGVPYGVRARTALAYMCEAAAAGRATQQLAKHVRRYIRELPQQPALLFVPLD